MKSILPTLLSLSLCVVAAGCAGRDAPPIAEGEGEGEGEGNNVNGSVSWSDEFENPSVHVFTEDTGVDFGMFHTVVLPVDNVPAALLTKRLCTQLADESEPTCADVDEAPAVEGDGAFRWGIDPSNYRVGFNFYEWTLILRRGDTVLDEDTLRFEVTR